MPLTAPLYPVGLVVEGRHCLVVGAGPVAARKVSGLLACGALVTVVAPVVHPDLEELAAAGRVALRRRRYEPSDLDGMRLVIAATGDVAVDSSVHADGEAVGVWVNAADIPAACSFTLPAVVRRGPITVSVATGGHSPALAGHLRSLLGAALPDRVDEAAKLLSEARAELQARSIGTESVSWERLVVEVVARMDADDEPGARRAIDAFLERVPS